MLFTTDQCIDLIACFVEMRAACVALMPYESNATNKTPGRNARNHDTRTSVCILWCDLPGFCAWSFWPMPITVQTKRSIILHTQYMHCIASVYALRSIVMASGGLCQCGGIAMACDARENASHLLCHYVVIRCFFYHPLSLHLCCVVCILFHVPRMTSCPGCPKGISNPFRHGIPTTVSICHRCGGKRFLRKREVHFGTFLDGSCGALPQTRHK